MKIGFFGGTFDPPHCGHLAVAEAALRECSLDRVLLAPTGRQPLKRERSSASFDDRLAMAKLLCEGNPRLEVSGIDPPLPDGEPNYTVDTLARLRAELGGDPDVYAIVGADSFLDLRRWREPERLLELAEWVVVSRPGIALDLAPLALTPAQRARVHVLDSVHVPVSATEVRALLRMRVDVDGMLPDNVLAYIRARHLYV